jgi:hypothetical protein
MASFVGGVYTSGWTIDGESQSSDPYDHVDDRGSAGGWKRPWHPMSPDSAPAPQATDDWEAGIRPVPKTAQSEPFYGFQFGPGEEQQSIPPFREPKTLWDRITPGKSSTPGEMLDQFEFDGLIPGTPILDIFGANKAIERVLPDLSVPGFPDLAAILPLMLIMTITKD